MKLKPNVRMAGLDPVMRLPLQLAERIWKNHGHELVITSALDGEHCAGSWHYYGRALDMRTRYFEEYKREEVAQDLREALAANSEGYRVFNEPTHIHVDCPL